MTITINGTTGIAGVDGSASTPALQGTDTNTGVYFGTDLVYIATGGTAAVTVDSGQRTKFPTTIGVGGATPSTSGSGVSFPATQSASTDANTLDDYEEGTFTPTYIGEGTAGTTTYTAQYGKYTKIGNTVTIWVDITFTAATGSGSILLGGLPFAVGVNPKPIGSCLTNNINWGGGTSLGIYGGDNGTTTLKLYSSADDVGWTENQISNESGRIIYTITYFV